MKTLEEPKIHFIYLLSINYITSIYIERYLAFVIEATVYHLLDYQ